LTKNLGAVLGVELNHPAPSFKSMLLTFDEPKIHADFQSRLSYLQDTQCKQIYDFTEKIGAGKFSIVYRCTQKDKKTNRNYAIKVIDRKTLKPDEIQLIHNETAIMKMLQYSSIIRFYEQYTSKDSLYIVTEYVKDGDLFDHIVNNEYLEEEEASFITKQLLLSIEYLHGIDIVHRDLKPENIMVHKDSHGKISIIKLIDFGFACLNEDKEMLHTVCGTPNYVAPEVINGSYGCASDAFSAGVIVYLMLRGLLPFDAQIPDLIINKTLRGDYQMTDTHWQNISEEGRDFVDGLLRVKTEERLTIKQALNHPWIRKRENLKSVYGANRTLSNGKELGV
jgi:serine/threonine protein kinase